MLVISTPTTILLALVLLNQFLFEIEAAENQCWSGSSNKEDSSYPPKAVDCYHDNMVCEVVKVKNLKLYISSCTTKTACNINKEAVGTDLGLYDSVDCCIPDLCNSYPGQPDAESAASKIQFIPIPITQKDVFWAGMWIMVMCLLNRPIH